MVDAKMLKAIKRLQGTGVAKLSKSEVGYRLLASALAAEEAESAEEAGDHVAAVA